MLWIYKLPTLFKDENSNCVKHEAPIQIGWFYCNSNEFVINQRKINEYWYNGIHVQYLNESCIGCIPVFYK